MGQHVASGRCVVSGGRCWLAFGDLEPGTRFRFHDLVKGETYGPVYVRMKGPRFREEGGPKRSYTTGRATSVRLLPDAPAELPADMPDVKEGDRVSVTRVLKNGKGSTTWTGTVLSIWTGGLRAGLHLSTAERPYGLVLALDPGAYYTQTIEVHADRRSL